MRSSLLISAASSITHFSIQAQYSTEEALSNTHCWTKTSGLWMEVQFFSAPPTGQSHLTLTSLRVRASNSVCVMYACVLQLWFSLTHEPKDSAEDGHY
ncbi:uncharacterized protein G2W53_022120 [Senna tora]|uniref:Uncharacterized protein n=1 Tax=Senna tora TaxID=362788 RepID=A0A834TN48_9FABA|nr:uncharacterized protein G2W53_022120 [Senna tora]